MRRQQLPLEQLQLWSHLNGVKLNSVAIARSVDGDAEMDKGAGLIATAAVDASAIGDHVILSVPSDLILSKNSVEDAARSDRHLRELLAAVGDFAQRSRGAILLFLLLQITHSSPDSAGHNIGIANPLTDYVKFLPSEFPLPTFYSEEERGILEGTSLKDALDQKLVSLEKEFQHLRLSTQDIEWCRMHWWDVDTGHLTFEDWKYVDAIYRSRGLELPGIGQAMVPILDMANHAVNHKYNARFEIQRNGNAVLVLRNEKGLYEGEEVTIMYGAGGACETLFSYGFLDHSAVNAREMFLSLTIPMDDPLRLAKQAVAKEAPGVRLYVDQNGNYCWESRYVWWACINEEDGLDFQILQQNDGTKELIAMWKNEELNPRDLEGVLMSDKRKDLFRLRAIVMMQQRLEQQGAALSATEHQFEDCVSYSSIRRVVWTTVSKLRSLELELLGESFELLEQEKAGLLDSTVVQEFLAGTLNDRSEEGRPEDEFL